jgi:hypothetical protein
MRDRLISRVQSLAEYVEEYRRRVASIGQMVNIIIYLLSRLPTAAKAQIPI